MKRTIRISRRRFMRDTAALVASGALLPACGGGEDPKTSGPDATADLSAADVAADLVDGSDSADDVVSSFDPDEVLLGLYPSAQLAEPADGVRLACAELDWSWLKSGDSVFVQLVCNSENSHPGVTSPAAVRAVCGELLERGAGKVLVGDQGGVEFVRLTEGDQRVGSTAELMKKNGLYQAIVDSGAEPYFFDEQSYADGYVEATFDFAASAWPGPPRIARVVTEVDHIVMLPRLSSHGIAGCSLGHKSAVGWLRDDSRYVMHFNGADIHALYTEVNYCKEIRDRLRVTLTFAEQLLLDFGPNDGTIAEADPRIVVASRNLANHDAVAVAVLAFIDGLTPPGAGIMAYGEEADTYNQLFLTALMPSIYGEPWGDRDMADYTAVPYTPYQQGVASDPALQRAYEIAGGVPDTIAVRATGAEPSSDLRAFLAAHDGGRIDLAS